MATNKGVLYLIPVPLGHLPKNTALAPATIEMVHQIDHFLVERMPSAIQFLQWIQHPTPDFKLSLAELNKRTSDMELPELLAPLMTGTSMGIISESGCPAVADPGSRVVRYAHQTGVKIHPLVGPSSILLALMASGMNGQAFSFHGYLPSHPDKRASRIRELCSEFPRGYAHLFIEAPFRNAETLKTLLNQLPPDSMLGIAMDLTLPSEWIFSQAVSSWNETILPEDFSKRPAIFMFQLSGSSSKAAGQRSKGAKPKRIKRF